MKKINSKNWFEKNWLNFIFYKMKRTCFSGITNLCSLMCALQQWYANWLMIYIIYYRFVLIWVIYQ
jgi:hypothetical protein